MTAMDSRDNELPLNWCARANGSRSLPIAEHALHVGAPKGVATSDLADVYVYNRQQLVATASRILRNHPDAEDAVHEALLSAFRFKDEFRGQSSVATWLTRVTIN